MDGYWIVMRFRVDIPNTNIIESYCKKYLVLPYHQCIPISLKLKIYFYCYDTFRLLFILLPKHSKCSLLGFSIYSFKKTFILIDFLKINIIKRSHLFLSGCGKIIDIFRVY